MIITNLKPEYIKHHITWFGMGKHAMISYKLYFQQLCCMFARAGMQACMHAWVRACIHACMHKFDFVCVCLWRHFIYIYTKVVFIIFMLAVTSYMANKNKFDVKISFSTIWTKKVSVRALLDFEARAKIKIVLCHKYIIF